MAAPSKKPTRPYLAASQRRDHLLEAAARLVRQGGWTALSMQGLAAAAGVSRQLVYEHFASADELSVATLVHLFERPYNATAAILHAGKSLDETIAATYELFLDLPADERRALRALASDLETVAQPIGRRQAPACAIALPASGCRTSAIRPVWARPRPRRVAWMLITAGWGLTDAWRTAR